MSELIDEFESMMLTLASDVDDSESDGIPTATAKAFSTWFFDPALIEQSNRDEQERLQLKKEQEELEAWRNTQYEFVAVPQSLRTVISLLPQKQINSVELRQLPQDIALEILDFQEHVGVFDYNYYSNSVSMPRLKDLIGRFDGQQRQFEVYHRCHRISYCMLHKIMKDKSSEMLAMAKFLFKNTKYLCLQVDIIEENNDMKQITHDFISACTRNKLFQSVVSIEAIDGNCRTPLDVCLPSFLVPRVSGLGLQALYTPLERAKFYFDRLSQLVGLKRLGLCREPNSKELIPCAPLERLQSLQLHCSNRGYCEDELLETICTRTTHLHLLEASNITEHYELMQKFASNQAKLDLDISSLVNEYPYNRTFAKVAVLPKNCSSLLLYNWDITSLSGIEKMPHLVHLGINRCKVLDVESYACLEQCSVLSSLQLLLTDIEQFRLYAAPVVNKLNARGQLKELCVHMGDLNQDVDFIDLIARMGFSREAASSEGSKLALRSLTLYTSNNRPMPRGYCLLETILECCKNTLQELHITRIASPFVEVVSRHLVETGVLLRCHLGYNDKEAKPDNGDHAFSNLGLFG